MYEELYIIDKSTKLRVDLSIPSGITLNFKSNIFGDLSKITCSYTYTFKLPLTANNRRVFDNADDIRCISNKIRRRLKAEYVQNGIPLFSNANLYIDSTETCFNAIMTWGVIDGFQTMKDDDISIQDLPLSVKPIFGPCNAEITEYSNEADFVQPLYNAGLPYVTENGWKDSYSTWSVFPLPAIPIYRLIQLINTHYGTKFNLGEFYEYGMQGSKNHKLISLGVIPCVNVDAPENTDTEKAVLQTNIGCYMRGPYAGIEHILTGATNDPAPTDSRFSLVKDSEGFTIGIKMSSDAALSFEIDGCWRMKFTHEPNQYEGQGRVEMGAPDTTGLTPKLTFYYTTSGTSAASLASVEGRFSWDNDWCWIFDFSKERGRDRVSVTIPPNATLFCAIEVDANALQMKWAEGTKIMRFFEQVDPGNIQWSRPENSAGKIPTDLMSNLPDISCMNLMKSLFFMMGAFPSIKPSGEIVPIFYTVLRENILTGNAVDWSSRMTTDHATLPTKTTYSISGFGQRNYYLMKNDSVDGDENEDESDVYADGKGIISVGNEIIEKDKTIIQLPFYAPYIKNKKAPSIPTGNTIKFWYYENDEVKTKEAKPCVGIIKPLIQKQNGAPTGKQWMSMEVWNDFVKINSDPSYSYLSRIMENPIVITENLRLNEHDLRMLDYTVPVYLEKYGAYFAIVSISRDSKGVCKCELIKLPEE